METGSFGAVFKRSTDRTETAVKQTKKRFKIYPLSQAGNPPKMNFRKRLGQKSSIRFTAWM